MNPRYALFTVGKRYKIRQEIPHNIDLFVAGEIVMFTARGFVPFLGSYGYQFHSDNDPVEAKDKVWLLDAREPAEIWHDYFEPID